MNKYFEKLLNRSTLNLEIFIYILNLVNSVYVLFSFLFIESNLNMYLKFSVILSLVTLIIICVFGIYFVFKASYTLRKRLSFSFILFGILCGGFLFYVFDLFISITYAISSIFMIIPFTVLSIKQNVQRGYYEL